MTSINADPVTSPNADPMTSINADQMPALHGSNASRTPIVCRVLTSGTVGAPGHRTLRYVYTNTLISPVDCALLLNTAAALGPRSSAAGRQIGFYHRSLSSSVRQRTPALQNHALARAYPGDRQTVGPLANQPRLQRRPAAAGGNESSHAVHHLPQRLSASVTDSTTSTCVMGKWPTLPFSSPSH